MVMWGGAERSVGAYIIHTWLSGGDWESGRGSQMSKVCSAWPLGRYGMFVRCCGYVGDMMQVVVRGGGESSARSFGVSELRRARLVT